MTNIILKQLSVKKRKIIPVGQWGGGSNTPTLRWPTRIPSFNLLYRQPYESLPIHVHSNTADTLTDGIFASKRHHKLLHFLPHLLRSIIKLKWSRYRRQRSASPAMAKSSKRIAFCAILDFSSVVRKMPGYTTQSRGTARTPLSQARRLHLSAWQTSHNSSLRQSQSGLRTQTANQPKFIPPIISPGLPRP